MRTRVTMAIVATLWCAPAWAHPGVSQEIDAVTLRLAKAPHDADLRLRRAALYRRLGHHHDALADLRRILKRSSDHDAARIERALTYVALGRTKAARADLDHVLADASAPSIAWAARARLHAAAERFDEARADFDRAIAKKASPDLYLERGRVDEATHAWAAAAAIYRDGLDATDGAVVLRLALLAAQRRAGRIDAALEQVDALLAAAPKRVEWILLRAELLADSGLQNDATIERLRALALAHAAVTRRPTELSRRALADTYRALDTTEPLI